MVGEKLLDSFGEAIWYCLSPLIYFTESLACQHATVAGHIYQILVPIFDPTIDASKYPSPITKKEQKREKKIV